MHVALLDSDDRPVAPGASGEICTRGPLVMTGYKDLPDETAEALSGDWLHTGDVGRFDDDGYLYIVDRTKDMVITGGFNVFPREVEDVISTHPAVSMVMVIGVPDDKWGEAVKAVVVLQPGREPSDELTRELQQLVKDAKGSQQSPKSIDYVDALPLTAGRQARQEGGAGAVLERRRSSGLVDRRDSRRSGVLRHRSVTRWLGCAISRRERQVADVLELGRQRNDLAVLELCCRRRCG